MFWILVRLSFTPLGYAIARVGVIFCTASILLTIKRIIQYISKPNFNTKGITFCVEFVHRSFLRNQKRKTLFICFRCLPASSGELSNNGRQKDRESHLSRSQPYTCYDLDDLDVAWLQLVNQEFRQMGE